MKIGFIVHPFHGSPESCSTHIWVHEVARRLTPTCFPIVYTARGRSQAATDSRDGVQYRRISIPSETRRTAWIDKLPIFWRLRRSISFRSSWYYCGYAFQVARDVRANQCDIVHILNLPQFAPIIRALNRRTKIILHLHTPWLTAMDVSSVARWLRSVDRVVGCSDFVTDQIRFAFPQFASRCATVYNGVDVECFMPNGEATKARDHKRLLYVGTVSAHKGVHVLLDALPVVLKRWPEAQLDMVGGRWEPPLDWLPILGEPNEMAKLLRFFDGKGYVSHLREQIRCLKLGDSVEFSGPSPHREVARWYRQADVFILPSVCNEAFGMPAAEAMSSGLPVVASRVGGLPEVVRHGETGFLVPPGNATALADAIIQLLEDEGLRRSMGQAGRNRVLQDFTWDKIAQDLMLHCEELVAAGKTRRG